MRRILVICGVLLALAATAAAETGDDDEPQDVLEDPRPGLITPDHPDFLWSIDIAADNALVMLGIRSAAETAHKRASEAVIAAESGDTAAVNRAVEEVERMAEQAHGINGDGLEAAEQLLLEVQDRVPDDAHTGIDTAIDEIRIAQERFPTDLPRESVRDQLRERIADNAPTLGGDQ